MLELVVAVTRWLNQPSLRRPLTGARGYSHEVCYGLTLLTVERGSAPGLARLLMKDRRRQKLLIVDLSAPLLRLLRFP